MKYKTIDQLKEGFFKKHPQVQRHPKGDYHINTKCAFDLWVEELRENGLITDELARQASL